MGDVFVWVLVVACVVVVLLIIRHLMKISSKKKARLAELAAAGWPLDYVVENYPGAVFDSQNSRFTLIHDVSAKVYSFDDIANVEWAYFEKITGPIVQREKNKVVLTLRDPDRPLVELDFGYDWKSAEEWSAKIPAILGW